MQLRSNVKALSFVKKLLENDTEHLLPFAPLAQKPLAPMYDGVRFPRSTPAAQGVPYALVDAFLRELAADKTAGVHSVLVLRHGKVIVDANFAPYTAQTWHVTHSLCKSFTGTAIGLLVSDGLLALDEKVCDILPEKCTFLTNRRMKSVTVEHLLSMTSGVNFREVGAVLEKDWARAFLESDFVFEAGTEMDYNSMNSYMLSAIVSKRTGKTLLEFLRERLFAPMGFGPVSWETCPLGITKGGWGMYLFLEDLAKLGQLYLQNGFWRVNGEEIELLDKKWIHSATGVRSTRASSGEEYGYQLWPHSADGSYMFNGMFGQYVIVYPDRDLIVAMNAGNGHLFTDSFAYQAVCRHFAPSALKTVPLPENKDEAARLAFTLQNLHFAQAVPAYTAPYAPSVWQSIKALFVKEAPPAPYTLPAKAKALIGKQLTLENNANGLLPLVLQAMCDSYPRGIRSISFAQEAEQLHMTWQEGDEVNVLPLGFDGDAVGVANINGTAWRVATHAAFAQDEDGDDVLKIRVCFLESSSTRLIKLFFTENGAIVKLDETPAVALALEKLADEQSAMQAADAFFKDFDYIQYKLAKLCTPRVRGSFQKNG